MAIVKTEKGQQAFKARSAELSPRQRSAFILCDGKRSLSDVLLATSGLGVTSEDIDHMLAAGMLEETFEPGPALVPQTAASAPPLIAPSTETSTPQARYQRAYPIATQLTAAMGLRGFRLNLAVEAAGSYEQLLELAPKIRDAVGDEKFRPLGLALSE